MVDTHLCRRLGAAVLAVAPSTTSSERIVGSQDESSTDCICSGVLVLNEKVYEYTVVIQSADKGGAYVPFPHNVREEFGTGRVKVHATFDGEPYDGSIVNMGVKNADGSVCYIIGIRKDIRAKIKKQVGDTVKVTIRERK